MELNTLIVKGKKGLHLTVRRRFAALRAARPSAHFWSSRFLQGAKIAPSKNVIYARSLDASAFEQYIRTLGEIKDK